MKNLTTIGIGLATIVLTVFATPAIAHCGGCGADSHTAEKASATMTTESTKKEKTIVETAVAAGEFETLVAAVTAADLVETLSGDGPFTVFAPTDAAFAELPDGTLDALLKDKAKLTSILTYHVIPGQVKSSDVVELESAETVNGQSVAITINDDGVMIDEAKIVATDINCSNGVIHVIDAVILPN